MGNRVVKFEFIPEENEEIEASIIVPKETRSIIHGVVKHPDGKVVKDAIVRLFEVNYKSEQALKPIANTFTDEDGEFLFGSLCTRRHYMIKVWFNSNKIKELIITPDEVVSVKDVEIESKQRKETGIRRDGYKHGFYYIDECNDDYDEENQ